MCIVRPGGMDKRVIVHPFLMCIDCVSVWCTVGCEFNVYFIIISIIKHAICSYTTVKAAVAIQLQCGEKTEKKKNHNT